MSHFRFASGSRRGGCKPETTWACPHRRTSPRARKGWVSISGYLLIYSDINYIFFWRWPWQPAVLEEGQVTTVAEVIIEPVQTGLYCQSNYSSVDYEAIHLYYSKLSVRGFRVERGDKRLVMCHMCYVLWWFWCSFPGLKVARKPIKSPKA